MSSPPIQSAGHELQVPASRKAKSANSVQLSRDALEMLAALASHDRCALSTLLRIVAHCGDRNDLVISRADLSRLADCPIENIDSVVRTLVEMRWIDVEPLDHDNLISAYYVNSEAAWAGQNNQRSQSKFSERLWPQRKGGQRLIVDAQIQKVVTVRSVTQQSLG